MANRLQRQSDDGAVRHPIEPQRGAGVGAAVQCGESSFQCAPSHAARGDERTVDVPQQNRRSHPTFLAP